MIIGTAYYPEHWERGRWEKDARQMKALGIDIIRMGEFGWSIMEREEGRYDFSFYEEALNVFGKYGIKTVMGTPTASPPKWLCDKIGHMYMEDKYGRKRGFGTRRHYCYNSEEYRVYSRKIVEKQVEYFKDNPNVIAWQIDNELGCEDEVRCYCENCRQKFIRWLRDKYASLERLNESWGTVFWSQTYTDWEQIILPKYAVTDSYSHFTQNPGLLYDYALFASDSLISYAKIQTDLIRSMTNKPIVHNVVSEQCDNYQLCQLLDRAGYDAYPRSEWDHNSSGRIGFHYALTAGYKNAPMWVLEQQSGPCGWNELGDTPNPGQLGLWTVQAAAYGAEAIVYFRWRSCPFGAEQFWYGILNHDGVPGRRYEELQSAVSFVKEQESILCLPNKKQALLIYSYENKFSHEIQRHHKEFDYKEEIIHYYEALKHMHLQVEIHDTEFDAEGYPVVILPFCSILSDKTYKRYRKYVREGGILILTPFTGLRTEHNQICTDPLPGLFREITGIKIEEFFSRREEVIRVSGGGKAVMWGEILEPVSAETICSYEDGPYKGKAAVTCLGYGKGKVYYIGCMMKEYVPILSSILKQEKIEAPLLDEEIEYFWKQDQEREYFILLNHGKERKICKIKGKETEIEGYGYKIL